MTVELTGKGIIGTAFAEQCKEVGRALRIDHEQNFEKRQNEAAEREAKQYVGQHRYYLRQKDLGNGFLQVESTDEFPLLGRLGAVGRGWMGACANLRFAYANELVKENLIPNLDDARRYVTRCTFLPDLTADLV